MNLCLDARRHVLAPTLLLLATFVLAGCLAEKKLQLSATDEGVFRFPSENSYWKGENVDLIGTLEFPERASGRVPAMVLFHGSAGQGYRDKAWSDFFLENGIAAFRVDYYTTRGMTRGGRGGPASSYDVTGAIKFLATHPRIDRERIGVIGFSRGGSMVLSALRYTARDTGGVDPALFVALYPGCERVTINAQTTDAPVRIIVGDRDSLSQATFCEEREAEAQRIGKDVRTSVMPGGTHAFDDNKGGTVHFGGTRVVITPNGELTRQARQIVREAMRDAFALPQTSRLRTR